VFQDSRGTRSDWHCTRELALHARALAGGMLCGCACAIARDLRSILLMLHVAATEISFAHAISTVANYLYLHGGELDAQSQGVHGHEAILENFTIDERPQAEKQIATQNCKTRCTLHPPYPPAQSCCGEMPAAAASGASLSLLSGGRGGKVTGRSAAEPRRDDGVAFVELFADADESRSEDRRAKTARVFSLPSKKNQCLVETKVIFQCYSAMQGLEGAHGGAEKNDLAALAC